MKKKELNELEKKCEICIHALRVETTGKILCTRTGDIRTTQPEKPCKKFKLDLLSYKPKPSKLPSFEPFEDSEIL